MNENSANFMNNAICTKENDELFYDRQKDRIGIISINEYEMLNQMFLINPEDKINSEKFFQQIYMFYSQNSILNYPQINEVKEKLTHMILNQSPSIIKYGLKMFIAIFCQSTYTFDYHFALSTLVMIQDYFKSDDQVILQYALQIAVKISEKSKRLAKLVYKYVNEYLTHILESEEFIIDVKEKAICILGHFCFSLKKIPDQYIDLICTMSYTIFRVPQFEKLQQSIIYCCALISQKVENFTDFFQKYQLFPFFNQILVQSHSAHIKYRILIIAQNLYKNPSNFDKIEINNVVNLMNHTIAAIQTTAIQSITEVIRSSREYLELLIQKDIFSLISSIFVNGAQKSKLACIEMLFLFYKEHPTEMTQVFIQHNYIETLMDLVQIIPQKYEKMIELIMMILIEMNKIMTQSGHKAQFEEIVSQAGAYNTLYDLIEYNNNVSDLAQTLLSDLEL